MPKFEVGELVTPKVNKKLDAPTSIAQGRVAIVTGVQEAQNIPGQTTYKLKWPDPRLDVHAGIMYEKDLKHAAGDPNARWRILPGGTGDQLVEYRSNNSGGRWWLNDDDWEKLEQAGWQVDWYSDPEIRKGFGFAQGDRFLGAKATVARKYFSKMGDAIREWEAITNENSSDLGCNCCGAPHSFSSENKTTGAHDYWSPSTPSQGARYEDD